MERLAAVFRGLDPRLKMGVALILGPFFWLLPPSVVAVGLVLLAPVVAALAVTQPLGAKMVRSLLTFLLFWVGLKVAMDLISSIPPEEAALSAGILALRLGALLLLGLALALSTSARALGLAVSWAVRPFVGKERAWKVALSLALMVHFLPLCLSTMNQVKESVTSRCPHFGFFRRMTIIPQAVIRIMGQKTWSQTLAIAGRRLDDATAWEPNFTWNSRDTQCAVLSVICVGCLISFL